MANISSPRPLPAGGARDEAGFIKFDAISLEPLSFLPLPDPGASTEPSSVWRSALADTGIAMVTSNNWKGIHLVDTRKMTKASVYLETPSERYYLNFIMPGGRTGIGVQSNSRTAAAWDLETGKERWRIARRPDIGFEENSHFGALVGDKLITASGGDYIEDGDKQYRRVLQIDAATGHVDAVFRVSGNWRQCGSVRSRLYCIGDENGDAILIVEPGPKPRMEILPWTGNNEPLCNPFTMPPNRGLVSEN